LIYGGEIFFEEPCYELHQSVEKSLKTLLIYHKIKFPKSHNIAELIDLLESNSVNIHDKIKKAVRLTRYAVKTRYPDEFVKVTKEEYEEAIKMAESVYNWVSEQIK
jgi:HEPN domain-containing protein